MQFSTLRQSGLRKIRSSAARFLSILLMVSLGAFVFVGLVSTAPSLEKTLFSYLEEQVKADLTISHPLGLDPQDQAKLERLPEVQRIVYAYQAQQLVAQNDQVLVLESLEAIPSYVVHEGRLPTQAGEIALAKSLADDYQIGQILTINSGEKDEDPLLTIDQFTVSGFVESPDYLSDELSSMISAYGDGTVAGFGVVTKDVFLAANPSQARLLFADVRGLEAGGKEYTQRMQVHEARAESLFNERSPVRESELQRSANRGLDDADQSLNQAEKQLASGRRSLDAAQAQIDQAARLQRQGQADLRQQRNSAREGLRQAEQELIQGQKTLDAAREQILAGEAELLSGKLSLEAGQQALAPLERQLKKEKRTLEQAQIDTRQAEAQTAAAQIELQAAQRELAQGQTKLNAARRELQANQQSLTQARVELQQAQARLSRGRNAILGAESQLNSLRQDIAELETAISQTQGQLTRVPAGSPEAKGLQDLLRTQQAGLQRAQSALRSNESQLNQEKRILAQSETKARQSELQIESSQRKINQGQETLRREQAELESSRETLYKAQQSFNRETQSLRSAQGTLTQAQAQLQAGQNRLNQESQNLKEGQDRLDSSRRALESAKSDLIQGQLELDRGRRELERQEQNSGRLLEQGQRQVDQGDQELRRNQTQLSQERQKYESAYDEALSDILEGRKDLADGRADLRRIQIPAYSVVTWASDPVVDNYVQSAQGMRLMSMIFPAFFYGICLLICMTTMTRMIDDERSEIGTLKALGYPNSSIMSNYIAYGAFAAIPGTLIGLLGGYAILMPVIVNAYYAGTVFHETFGVLPPFVPITALILDLACTSFAAYSTARIQLRSQVSVLLRPVPPKAGTRIFMERITPLWSRLNFNQKITFRNLFRYKKRGALTIIGVAGCMALITMGFGLNYAINGIFERQFGEIQDYDLIALYDDKASAEDQEELLRKLRAHPSSRQSTGARYETAILPMPGTSDQALTLVTPSDPEAFQAFVDIRDPDTGLPHDLRKGPLLSEKTARILGLKAGDMLAYETDLGEERRLPIAGVFENYVGHQLYISPEDYQVLLEASPTPNALYLQIDDPLTIDSLSRDFLNSDIAFGSIKASSSSDQVAELTESLGIVVNVILVVSLLLALVVLYNLTNINVEERMRELSTIKVLGFYPKEVTAYIYRETLALTFVGIIFGAALGKALHTLIARAMAPASVMMVEYVLPQDYLFGLLFTLGASFAVMIVMHRKLQRVDMVEALKGVE